MCDTVLLCKLEDGFQVSIFSFYLMGPRDQTQVFRLGESILIETSRWTSLHIFEDEDCLIIILIASEWDKSEAKQ